MSPAQLTSAFYLLLTSSLVLYVYRFAVAGVNMSAFRLILLGWLGWLVVDLVRGRVRPERKYWPLMVITAALLVLNAVDFLTLGGHGALRRDIANHLLNLSLAGLVCIYVDTEGKRVALLRAFVLSSLLTSAISLYSALTDRLPFESLIRTLGSEQGRTLAYISDDSFFERATAAFFDPNFYGVYSLLVLVAIVYLWLYARPSRLLAALFALNLVCLAFTLSRTALVGTLAAMGMTFVLSRRSRLFAVVTGVSAVGMLYVATTLQSHQGRKEVAQQAIATWQYLVAAATTDRSPVPDVAQTPGRSSAGAQSPSASAKATPGTQAGAPADERQVPRVPSFSELSAATTVASARVADGKSIEGRMQHIRQGLAVFRSSPLYGRGSAALLGSHTSWSSAHVSYLTLLARYGAVGFVAYMAFLLVPLWIVWMRGHSEAHRFFVTLLLGTLMVVYLGYDILLFFEVQYLFFGLTWGMAVDARTNTATGSVFA